MLAWTGERFLPNVGVQIANEHYLRYLFALDLVAGKSVLDCPSGEGYGSNILSSKARGVIGVDISPDAVLHCQDKYQKENLHFKTASMADLSMFADESFDVITCFEGIEHVDQDVQHKALGEFKRVLKNDGLLIISTPNKKVYSDIPNYKNEYHVKEFYEEEFGGFLRLEFPFVSLFGQSIFDTGMLVSLAEVDKPKMRVSFFKSEEEPELRQTEVKDIWTYFVATCSKRTSGAVVNGALLVDPMRRIWEEKTRHFYEQIEFLSSQNGELRRENDLLDRKLKRTTRVLGRTVEGRLRALVHQMHGFLGDFFRRGK